MHIPEALCNQLLRHTGARSFIRSSTISDDRAIARDFRKVLLDIIGRHPDSSGQFCFGFTPGYGISRVNKRKFLPTIHSFLDLVHSDSRSFHFEALLFQHLPILMR